MRKVCLHLRPLLGTVAVPYTSALHAGAEKITTVQEAADLIAGQIGSGNKGHKEHKPKEAKEAKK
jgi:hypothetical protein